MSEDHRTPPANSSALEVPNLPDAVEDGWGSDRIARLLREFDIPYLCLNPGSSFRGLHDSVVNLLGNRDPQMLVCLHEEHAVAIAQGYAKVTGRPLAVVLHANVGLMHGTMAIFNAWCDRMPMLVLGATGPVDSTKRRPWIDWIHTARDQASIVRPYTKWDDQPASVEAAEEALLRAMQVTSTHPRAPVYVVLDAGLQEAPYSATAPLPDITKYRPIAPPAPDPRIVADAAERLRAAQSPALLIGRVSRDPEAWAQRVALAERLGAMVLTDIRAGASFPTDHPLHAGPPALMPRHDVMGRLADADVVLSLDWVDLAGILTQTWPDGSCPATVIQVSMDHHIHNGWSFDHLALPPVDIHLATHPDVAVPLLGEGLPAASRTYEVEAKSRPPSTAGGHIVLAEIAEALQAATRGQPVTLTRLPLGWDGDYWHFRDPLDYLGHSGGGGVGSGPGVSVGAALALMDSGRLPVAILGDGDCLMGATALWTAVHYRIPLLVIVTNNRSYFNDEVHQERVALKRNRPVENRWIGQRIADPEPDLAQMARAQGAVGIGPVRDHDAMTAAFAEAVAAVRDGAVALVDVHVAPGYAPAATASFTTEPPKTGR